VSNLERLFSRIKRLEQEIEYTKMTFDKNNESMQNLTEEMQDNCKQSQLCDLHKQLSTLQDIIPQTLISINNEER
jgi:hypothetical protein